MVDELYYAYGRKRRGGTLPTEHNYTGQRKDASGLLYYNARYYDPELGAFISPDTIVPEPGNLLDYNRYTYVRGNPLTYNDPSGHVLETAWDAVNIGIGAASLAHNVRQGNWGDAAWDAGGLVVDVAATAVPFVPGGAASVLKARNAVKGVQKMDAVLHATARASRRLIQHGDEPAGLRKMPRHVLDNALQGFTNKTLARAGGELVTLTKERMGHILSRHTPEYWGAWEALGHRQRQTNTAFDAGLSIDDITHLLQETLKALGEVFDGSIHHIREIDGKWYKVVVEDKLVQQFIPCPIGGCP